MLASQCLGSNQDISSTHWPASLPTYLAGIKTMRDSVSNKRWTAPEATPRLTSCLHINVQTGVHSSPYYLHTYGWGHSHTLVYVHKHTHTHKHTNVLYKSSCAISWHYDRDIFDIVPWFDNRSYFLSKLLRLEPRASNMLKHSLPVHQAYSEDLSFRVQTWQLQGSDRGSGV